MQSGAAIVGPCDRRPRTFSGALTLHKIAVLGRKAGQKPEIWTTLKVLTWTKGYLAEKGVENARLEAEWLLCAALGLDRVGLYLNFDRPLTDAELAAYRAMVARRARREPLQYILGTQEFMGLEFAVTPAVLIPRHDTEVLVEEALKRAAADSRILDIGVGSGCIAVALAAELPGAEVCGVENSAGSAGRCQRITQTVTASSVTIFDRLALRAVAGRTLRSDRQQSTLYPDRGPCRTAAGSAGL